MWCTNKFNIQQFYALPTLYFWEQIATCVTYTQSDRFYNRDEKCLLRGKNWGFK